MIDWNEMNSTFTDYFRCPENFGEISGPDSLLSENGFFLFAGCQCFGRSVQDMNLPSSAAGNETHNGNCRNLHVRLPFDLTEVIENLRLERYVARAKSENNKLTETTVIRKIYYLLRPLFPVALRRHLQRIHFSDWKEISFPSWPIDTTVDRLFRETLRLLLKSSAEPSMPFIWFWPEGYTASAIMTHDVEHEPGLNFCSKLMDIDDEYGIKSSFQIVPEERYSVPQGLLSEIRKRGFEANVHDLNHDGHLFENRNTFLSRVEKINNYRKQFAASGFRAGAMYRNSDWLPELKFTYDMSMPNAAHLEPQRGGCCTVMPYRIGELIELPLTMTQDYSLFYILGKKSLTLWNAEVEFVVGNHGLATFIVHPDYVLEPGFQRLYRDLLKLLAGMRDRGDLWMPLPCELAEWWQLRSKMFLERNKDKWSIRGEGSERARIAFASLEGDRLIYTVGERRFDTINTTGLPQDLSSLAASA